MKRGDKRTLTQPLRLRTSYSVSVLPIGATITVQQVNETFRQVLVHNVWFSARSIADVSEEVTQE